MSSLLKVRNIKCVLAYDGTRYKGWQSSKHGLTIESELTLLLRQILQEEVQLNAASRTDAGVHAVGQVVNFLTFRPTIDMPKLKMSLNRLLPKDITVVELVEAPAGFHATLDTRSKEYRYTICNDQHQMPHRRHYSWHYSYPLDLVLMRGAAKQLLGEHAFTTFCNVRKNQKYDTYVRHLLKIEIVADEDKQLHFEIQGDHFLYKMVRNLVGTLVYLGCGKLKIDNISSILKACDRTQAGITAPAHGLTLYKVFY